MHARDYQPDEAVPGTVYRVIRVIGAGGMGTVYDVEDTTIGKRYVLKTLHAQFGAREDLARRMQTEARTLARLNHSNIVEIITAGVTADDLRLPYYVMERLNGQSLRVVLAKKGRLELPHVHHIGIDLLDALDHAHDKGVIHRDVKPDNIFLHRTAGGVTVTKLLDFGIVSVLDDGHSETAGRFLGTLRYAAPEQLRGEKPTPKTDVYAAALVLYECIAGRGPFDDEADTHRIGSAHLYKMPPPVSRFAPVPKELDALLLAALAKSPDARPRDAFSFAASLRNLKRADAGTGAASVSTPPPSATTQADAAGASRHPHPSPNGPYVISPVPPSNPPTHLPKTTLLGMAPPSVAPPPAVPSFGATTLTTPDAIDRSAVTRTLSFETSRLAGHGTEPMSADEATVPGSIAPADTIQSEPLPGAMEWPQESSVVRSDAPQMRSLPAEAPARSAWGTIAASALALAAAALGVGAVVFLQGRPPVVPSAAGPARASTDLAAKLQSVSPAASVAPLPVPVVAPLPEPVAAPGAALAPPPGPAASASAATGSRSVAPSSAPTTMRTAPQPSLASSAARRVADRPGPGF